jgi:hypothetical protein
VSNQDQDKDRLYLISRLAMNKDKCKKEPIEELRRNRLLFQLKVLNSIPKELTIILKIIKLKLQA